MVLKLEADSILQQKEQQKDISIKNCTTAEQVLWMMQLHYCTIALLHYCTKDFFMEILCYRDAMSCVNCIASIIARQP
jgi:hypothetical protein